MNSFFDKLNLRPGERRLVVIVALVVFLVVNAFLVWPRFLEWGKVTNQETGAVATRNQYQREVDNIKKYQLRLAELAEKGASVGTEDQALKLSSTLYSQAALSGVNIINSTVPRATGNSGGKTNMFFDEQSAVVTFIADEKSLVDFLYNFGAGASMIRVRSMQLSPDPPHFKLQGNLTLVASYQRTTPARPAAATTTTTPIPRTNSPAGVRPPAVPPRAAISNAPPQKTNWFSRLWPFGKKADAANSTNAAAKANSPAKTNAPPNK